MRLSLSFRLGVYCPWRSAQLGSWYWLLPEGVLQVLLQEYLLDWRWGC